MDARPDIKKGNPGREVEVCRLARQGIPSMGKASLPGFRSIHNPSILTNSEEEVDIVKSYQPQTNCYYNKPLPLDAFAGLDKSINDLWLTKVALPPHRQSI